jgi:hypothetical protein
MMERGWSPRVRVDFPKACSELFPSASSGKLELITLVVSVAGQKRLVFAVQACYGDALALAARG